MRMSFGLSAARVARPANGIRPAPMALPSKERRVSMINLRLGGGIFTPAHTRDDGAGPALSPPPPPPASRGRGEGARPQAARSNRPYFHSLEYRHYAVN